MKLPLEKAKDLKCWASKGSLPWKACSPFLENARAVLIHRPRNVTTHKLSEKYDAHVSVTNWCGSTFSGGKHFTFLDAVPEGKLLCARCEEKAVNAGIQSSHELTGRHVHLGGVVAVQLCCVEKESK